MAFQRDPLSIQYDAAAGELIRRAILAPGRAVTGVIASPASAPAEARYEGRRRRGGRHAGPRARPGLSGLTAHERAFTRALYHDERIRKPSKSPGAWSLKVEWEPRAAGRRLVRIRVFSDTSAARYAASAIPAGEQWQHTRELQSGAAGSGKERFA